ncbi:MAG TPA: YkoF family thiamine/hydroxymethylpyrimidine-binding protein [Caldisericia bacterium]|nr:YkoF family thiamine/hydroxymethylpyrimidine-binding protein [Caldisericia bacterium]HPF49528.1 YkoF family thiamine/hydroxymethylpyrimidine-binding protein [Caldisericia bacterium]HPI84178.1 YkoF family thiamine/hydroxymethylpyrimidine-binding protein [Caldisericia bacterium]HPQ93527.1 YkoF family thiamine/hydroxymethylpyrimidine-binding protein [Caldisericia bacterium]HRV75467.1 YkoF family thiamine/hydroxymethylpyrimidine-binding protein [Caldisericia bacterium]
MNIKFQVSIYPLETKQVDSCVLRAIDSLKDSGVEYVTNDMSTVITADSSKGFEVTQKLFEKAASEGKVVMNVTVSNACG